MFKKIKSGLVLVSLICISWILLTAFTLHLTALKWTLHLEKFFHGDMIFFKNLFLMCFFLFVFLFFKGLYSRIPERNNREVERGVFSITLVCLFLHLIIIFLEHYAAPPFDLAIWLNVLNNFNILIGTVFCANCFFFFKRLILFQKSNHIDFVWKIFEFMIFGSIALTIFNVDVTEILTALGLAIYACVALYLSTQMRWVAFLSKSQKVTEMIRFLVYFLTFCLILQNFFFESFAFGESGNTHLLVIDCAHKFFLLSTFTFVLFYSISSILILLFNLPTSSAFEQKIKDANNYKRLSQTLYTGKDVNQIYKVLLEISFSTSKSKIGYIYLKSSKENNFVQIENIDSTQAKGLHAFIMQTYNKRNFKEQQVLVDLTDQGVQYPLLLENEIKSVLITPIQVKGELVGYMGLYKDVEDGFEIETVEIINSYSLQTSISVENRGLLQKAIESERYQEEIKIAKSVKNKLLSNSIDLGKGLDVAVLSKSSDQVGGDFFDSYKLSEDLYVVVLGDVSGHGTSAAFNMAQLKGIFQTTVRNVVNVENIPSVINEVLYHCLESESFVTMSFFILNNKINEMSHYRCGHNPSLFLQNGFIKALKSPGIGLGMIANEKFSEILESEVFHVGSGDVLLCYTDGFIEAKNTENEYFGLDRIEQCLADSGDTTSQEVVNNMVNTLTAFTSKVNQNDDYSCLVIKF